MSKEWKFAQCFGDKADIISTVEFDHTGNYLATGDKGGRVVLFERNEKKKQSVTSGSGNAVEYKFYTEFQSHEPEFDYLKSLEIEEKINQIRWIKRVNQSHFLLSTNDKTIKLWKVFDKNIKAVTDFTQSDNSNVNFPTLKTKDKLTVALPKKVYGNAHAYHINSISMNSDLETFISADDLRVNLWNLNYEERSFNIVDIKPVNMEELTEVITAAQFHPTNCHQLIYASSKGNIKLCDLRDNALCDNHCMIFEEEEDPSQRSFFSEIISSVSDVKFSIDGKHILSRDYLSVKLWDIRNSKVPIQTYLIHEHLKSKLCDLYENDCIFDKFEALYNGNSTKTLVGSYSNYLGIIDLNETGESKDILLKADKIAFKEKKKGIPIRRNTSTSDNKKTHVIKLDDPTGNSNIDFNKKILHASYHPYDDVIAVAATNNLFIFANQ